jgi:hypothetical protein
MSNQIPGVPEGWELVRIDKPTHGEWFIDGVGLPKQYPYENPCGGFFPIIRKIEKPAAYRPFKDAEEFKPHRDRWWYRDDKDGRRHFPPASYSDQAHGGATWKHRFETCFFDDDGTPFGVRIDE